MTNKSLAPLPWRCTRPRALRVSPSLLLAALCAGLTASCAHAPRDPIAAAEAAVRQRAQQRADAIVRNDSAAAYALAAPSYRRLVTLEVYAMRRAAAPVQWLAARVHQVQCPMDGAEPPVRCSVQLEVTSQLRLPLAGAARAPFTGFLQQTWVRDGDQWWMLEEL